jgi:hypothetical protein
LSCGGPDLVLLSECEGATGQALAIALLLVDPDLTQHGAEPLVGDDGTLLNARDLVKKDPTGERRIRVAELDASVLVLVDTTSFAGQSKRLGPGLHEVDDSFVVEGQILRELALLLPGESQVEILVVADRSVCIVTALRLAREALIVVGEKLRQVGVRRFGR